MERQKQVLKAFNNDKDLILSKSDIKQISGIGYYRNTDKHLGDVLSRMVKNGSLIRVKRGYFQLGQYKKRNTQINNPNQSSLF